MNDKLAAMAQEFGALRVMAMAAAGERTRKILTALSDLGISAPVTANTSAQAVQLLKARDVDMIVADLHPDFLDTISLPLALTSLFGADSGRQCPHILWSGDYSPAVPRPPSGAWLTRAARAIDGRERACVGGILLGTLEAHAYQAAQQGIHIEIIRSAGPLGLYNALRTLTAAPAPGAAAVAARASEPPPDEDLIDALVSGKGLSVQFQPQHDLQTRKIVGAEALIRWRHPRLGDIPPAGFLPSVRRLGLDLLLFSFVRGRAMDVLRELRAQQIDIPIAVNASLQTVCTPGLAERLSEVMTRADLPKSLLKIELTEDARVDDALALSTALNILRAHGFKVSLDDFGTGSATLGMLADMPFDEIKIDALLARDLHARPACRTIAAVSIELAGLLNVKVVAEGIETEADAALLRRLGCRTGQGYAFSRPMDAQSLLDRILGATIT